MATPTVENYVKQLYLEQQRTAQPLVPLGRLAGAMGVAPGTATAMVKALADSGLVHYESRSGTKLTRSGEKLALHVLRRHRLLELFLVRVLALDWSEVHEEAEVLEHVVSERVLERIDRMLGHPTVDPHGDLIPDAAGRVLPRSSRSLADCTEGQRVRIARVESDEARFLKFAEEHGLTPGTEIAVEGCDPAADSVAVRAEGRPPLVLGTAAARRIHVETGPRSHGQELS